MELSEVMVDAIKHVDDRLKTLNFDSVNLIKLRRNITTTIVSKAYEISKLDIKTRYKSIDVIYRKCLTDELTRKVGE